MTALDRFLAIRRAVALWEAKAAADLGASTGWASQTLPSSIICGWRTTIDFVASTLHSVLR